MLQLLPFHAQLLPAADAAAVVAVVPTAIAWHAKEIFHLMELLLVLLRWCWLLLELREHAVHHLLGVLVHAYGGTALAMQIRIEVSAIVGQRRRAYNHGCVDALAVLLAVEPLHTRDL